METVKLPLGSPVYRNVVGEEVADLNSRIVSGYIDELQGIHRQPGLSQLADLNLGANSEIDGLYWWEQQGYALCVSSQNVYKLTYSSGTLTATQIGATNTQLQTDTRVSFASDGDNVYMANGGKIVHTDGSSLTTMGDSDAPDEVTHIAWLDGYLIANHASENRFYWSDVNNETSWNALSFASAAGNADYITSIKVVNREIYLIGPQTVEIWQNDGRTPFSRIPGGFIQTGAIAPYSVVFNGRGLMWLDENRHFVEFDGRSSRRITSTYDREVQGFSSITDAIGDRVEIAGQPFIIFHFPGENKTLVYNVATEGWSEWGYYVGPGNSYSRWLGNNVIYAPAWGFHLVGDRSDSLLHRMSPDYYDDNGAEIRLYHLTGHVDHGTHRRKRSREVRVRIRRGSLDNSTTTDSYIMLRWRDDNQRWSNEHRISLGKIGESEIFRRIQTRGTYRTRQYELTCTDGVPVMYIDAEEDVDFLR